MRWSNQFNAFAFRRLLRLAGKQIAKHMIIDSISFAFISLFLALPFCHSSFAALSIFSRFVRSVLLPVLSSVGICLYFLSSDSLHFNGMKLVSKTLNCQFILSRSVPVPNDGTSSVAEVANGNNNNNSKKCVKKSIVIANKQWSLNNNEIYYLSHAIGDSSDALMLRKRTQIKYHWAALSRMRRTKRGGMRKKMKRQQQQNENRNAPVRCGALSGISFNVEKCVRA